MSLSLSSNPTPQHLQERLAQAADDYERVRWLTALTAHYVYTEPAQARRLLDEQAALYATGHPTDTQFHYYRHLGNLENQLYHDEAALPAYERALALVDEHGDIAEKIEVYLDFVGTLVNLDQLERARALYDRSLRLLESYTSGRLQSRALCRQGFFHLHDHSYAKAIPVFMEALGLLDGQAFELNTKDHYVYTLVNSGLGTLWTRPDSEDKAADAFRNAIDRCEARGLMARLPWHQLHLGKVLLGVGDYEGAINYFTAIIDTAGNGSRGALAAAYVNLAMGYSATARPSNLIAPLLDASERLYRGMDQEYPKELFSIELERAALCLAEDDFAGAIQQLQDTLEDLEQRPDGLTAELGGIAAEICTQLASCYAGIEEFELAYYMQRRADEYLDQYVELQDVKRQERFEAQFKAEAREKERESLQLRASQLQLRALRAQMNPHFLYNALNSIQSFITTNEASTASKYLAKFAMLMRRSLEYTNREYITLEDEIQFLQDYLDINCHLRFAGKLSYDVRVLGDLEEDILGVPTMILQPYVENAIEHGLRTRPQGHISVHFAPIAGDDENIIATVTDDGIGRARVLEMQADDPTRPYHQSRGTSITRSRLELLTNDPENRVLIDDLFHPDATAAGTRVTVRIPVTDVLLRRSGH